MKMRHLVLILLFALNACISTREASCEEAAEANRLDELEILVEQTSNNPYQLEILGKNPKTSQSVSFKRVNYTWAQWFIDQIEAGDTVVKKKGELVFYIHKKDSVLAYPFECKGEIYE